MQLDDVAPAGAHRITGYGAGYFLIDGARYEGGVVVTPEGITAGWTPRTIEDLDAAALEVFDGVECEVVLLGTGRDHRFPDAALLAPLMARGVGVEVMSSDAACRTYNILMSEGRRVVALLIALAAAG